MYEKIRNILLLFLALVIVFKFYLPKFFKTDQYDGPGYSLKIPIGWEKQKINSNVYGKDVEAVTFTVPEINTITEQPVARITILAKRLTAAFWVEDEFPSILQSISENGYQIMDRGEIKISDQISKWVVFYDKRTDLMELEFYMVTESNIFYRIQYVTDFDKFQKYRPGFEYLKDSFKVKIGLF